MLGTLVAIALVRQRLRGQTAVDTFLVLPLTAPEVVMGAALLTLFLDFGWAAGYTTILIAHVAFEISFIAMTVRARVRGFDWTLEDASMDLGASPTRTFFKVTLPLIVPGIVAAAMLSFALSLDDFIITYFVSGSTVTYPLYVNAAVKAAVPPQINVLATAILVISLILLGARNAGTGASGFDGLVQRHLSPATRPRSSRSATAWPVRSAPSSRSSVIGPPSPRKLRHHVLRVG